MMEIDITKMSSKGQVVIPREMRKDIKEGDKLIVIQNGEQLILKKASNLDENMKEDLEFARRTEEAWKRYDKGEFIEMDFDDLIRKMKKW
jgi:AbrB family looped-hinge helix DNA binding protein